MTTMNGSTTRIHGVATSKVRINAHAQPELDRTGFDLASDNTAAMKSTQQMAHCRFEIAISRNAISRMQREGSLKGVDSLAAIPTGTEDLRLVFAVEKRLSTNADNSLESECTPCLVHVYLSDPSNRSRTHTIITQEAGCWLDDGSWLHVDVQGLVCATLRRDGDSFDVVYLRTVLLGAMGFAGGRYEPVRTLNRPALAGSNK